MLPSTPIDKSLVVRPKNLGPETQRGYESQLERFLTDCTEAGVLGTSQLRALHVAQHIDALRTHPGRRGRMLSSRILRTYAKRLRVFARWLVAEKLASEKALRVEGAWGVHSAAHRDPCTGVNARARLSILARSGCASAVLPSCCSCSTRAARVRSHQPARTGRGQDQDPHVLASYGKGGKVARGGIPEQAGGMCSTRVPAHPASTQVALRDATGKEDHMFLGRTARLLSVLSRAAPHRVRFVRGLCCQPRICDGVASMML
jgi:hypothetical protein